MVKRLLRPAYVLLLAAAACGTDSSRQTKAEAPADTPVAYQPGEFGYDLRFLRQYDSVLVLKSDDGSAQVIVSPKYQAKVFTSTAAGDQGISFGWVNYKAFDGPVNEHMNGYGGENRLWLGPEGGPFSVFFKPGAKMSFENWKTPPPYDTENWQLERQDGKPANQEGKPANQEGKPANQDGKATSQDGKSVTLSKEMKLENYHGEELSLRAERSVTLLEKAQIEGLLGSADSIRAVGYQTINRLTNTGNREWTKKSGAPCIWMLDMFRPSDSTAIVIPVKNPDGEPLHRIATTDYFGEIGADRLKDQNNTLFFKADGKKRGKLGLFPRNTAGVAGSYNAQNGVLTLIFFDVDTTANYLNQQWRTDKPPFSGDAMNAYNDGPLADGTQMGPFYEMESVAPAAMLKPGATEVHHHTVIHCMGERSALDRIAEKVLHVSLETIEKAF